MTRKSPNDERTTATLESHVTQAARTLEQHCPEQVLEYYRSGVPTLRAPRERKHYAAIAFLLRDVRRVWVDILEQPDTWRAYAREIKFAHPRFPAFHEECARVLRDW